MNARTKPALLLVLLALSAPGCWSSSEPVANDTPARKLVRDAEAMNKTAKAAYSSVRRANRVGLLSDARFVSLEPWIDAVEAGRRDLTRIALEGDEDKYDAALSALIAALGELASAQLEADAVATQPRPPPAPVAPAATRPTR